MNIHAPDILLVEDSQTDVNQFMLAHELNKSAASVSVARDGAQALGLLLGGGCPWKHNCSAFGSITVPRFGRTTQ